VELTDAELNPLPPPVSHYIPLDLWDCNIGTKEGFNSALDRLDEFYSTCDYAEQVYVIADINIYWRYNRVCESGALSQLGQANPSLYLNSREPTSGRATPSSSVSVLSCCWAPGTLSKLLVNFCGRYLPCLHPYFSQTLQLHFIPE